MKKFPATPDPRLIRCTAWFITRRRTKEIRCYCQKHGTRISTVRLGRASWSRGVDGFVKRVTPLFERHVASV